MTTEEHQKSKGSILWIFFHLFTWLSGIVKRNKVRSGIVFAISFFIFLVGRAYFQPIFLRARILLMEIILLALLVGSLYYLVRKGKRLLALLLGGASVLVVFLITVTDSNPHYYQTLYFQFNTLDKRLLDQLPETQFERIHPLHSIHTATNKRIGDTLHTTIPDYVSWGPGDPHWTVGVEPAYLHQRIFGDVERVFSLPGQNHLLDFSGENQISVEFDSGEGMYFVKDTSFLVRQGLGLWRFFSFEPSNVKYIPGPDGELVQCVSLIQWDGVVFPRPHFGGVVIIEQGDVGFWQTIGRSIFGAGTWIRPEEIEDHEWLVGQNLVPYEVSRHVANSFRFRYGYLAPFPATHYKDIRIPDLPGDVNDQPFTMYFHFGDKDKKSKLYHYFALEPFQDEERNRDKTGLSISILFPADGIGSVYYYEHGEKEENLTGVSSVSTYIKESQKNYDWTRNEVAEHRPFVRSIDGKNRLFWLSTVVTKSDTGDGFIAGSSIDTFLTDAASAKPIKVNAAKPDSWVEQIVSELK